MGWKPFPGVLAEDLGHGTGSEFAIFAIAVRCKMFLQSKFIQMIQIFDMRTVMICQKCVGTHLDLSTYGANPRIFVEFEVFSDGSDLRKGLNPAVGMKLGKTIELNPWVTAVRSALAADNTAQDHLFGLFSSRST